MLDALVADTADPTVLAELAKGKLRAKIPALKESLVGRFDRQHAPIVSAILAYLDFLDERTQALSDEIGEQLAPFAAAADLHDPRRAAAHRRGDRRRDRHRPELLRLRPPLILCCLESF
jgi:hypothetical protein